jgi:Metallo-peptidase family M12B Reprolysin-like
VWRVSSNGGLARLGDSGSLAGEATLIRSALDPRGRVVTAVRDGSGDLKLITWGVSSNGATVQRLGDSGSAAGGIGGNSLASLPDGVVSAVRTDSGTLKLIAWTVNASGSLTRRSDSGSQAGEASSINLISNIGVNGLTMVTPVRTGSGTLKLIGWGPACVRLHLKIVQQPNVAITTMVDNMRQVYGSVGVGVTLASTETLNLPATFLDIEVGGCSGSTTSEQDQLFSNRNNAGANDVVVYFVRSTVPPFNGCASHPSGRPGAVVASIASQWTMAHEVGHVLGLSHVNDNNRLMTGNGTSGITNPPPDLVPTEVSTMQSSAITQPC